MISKKRPVEVFGNFSTSFITEAFYDTINTRLSYQEAFWYKMKKLFCLICLGCDGGKHGGNVEYHIINIIINMVLM